MNHRTRGSGGEPRPSTLDGRVRRRRAIEAGKHRKPGEEHDARKEPRQPPEVNRQAGGGPHGDVVGIHSGTPGDAASRASHPGQDHCPCPPAAAAGQEQGNAGAPTENAQGRHPMARRRKGKPGVSNRRNRRITTRWPFCTFP